MFMIRGVVSVRKAVVISFCFLVLLLFVIIFFKTGNSNSSPCQIVTRRDHIDIDKDGKPNTYNRSSPFIFIGGFPRSGTTLVRAMLDAHADVRCGEETRVLPRILQMAAQWNRSAKETNRLHEAGLTDEIIENAVASFILEVVVKHGEPAPRICNKDPFTLKYGTYLLKLFPKAKFIFMIRDGRAVVHSLITRAVTVTGFNLTSYRKCLTKWSNAMKTILKECNDLGQQRCLKVKYEDLVLHPRSQMEGILNYLDLPWTEDVMHHEKFINKPGGVSISKMERSSEQVVKPVNVQALSKWVGRIPQDVVRNMEATAPMLRTLGYDPKANPPNYGTPDAEIVMNTNDIVKYQKYWFKTAQDILQNSKPKKLFDQREN